MVRQKYQYIDKEFYEAQLNVDLIAEQQEAEFPRAVYYASALINAFTGNKIEGSPGWENLTQLQQGGVKEAVVFQVAYFLNSGELDGQRGHSSYQAGGQSFTLNMPDGGEKTLRIDEKAIFALQQVGLLNTIVAIDPIQVKRDQSHKIDRKHIYHRWNIEAMDESLFVSDGTTEDGGKVRLKISDSYQAQIEKVSGIAKIKNHLVYTSNLANVGTWNDNALIYKRYVDDRTPQPGDFKRVKELALRAEDHAQEAKDLASITNDVAWRALELAKKKQDKGDKGPKGDKGDKGDRGPQGEPGKDGKDGKDCEGREKVRVNKGRW